MKRLRASLAALPLLLGAPAALAPAIAQERVQFTILHFGEIPDIEPMRPAGDLARIATVIARERSERRTVIVTHAGNALSPSFASAYDHGEHMVRMLNRMLVDVMVAGNHEFDFGPDNTLQRLRQLDFPVLSANALDGNVRPEPLRASHAVAVGRFKIVFIGATTTETPAISSPGRIRFTPVAHAVAAEAERARAEGADLVVLLSAANDAETAEAAAAGRIDLVLTRNGPRAASTRYDGERGVAAIGLDGNLMVAVDIDIQRITRDVGAEIKLDEPDNATGEITVEPQRTEQVVEWRPTFRIVDSRAYVPDQLIEIATQVELDLVTAGLSETVATVTPAISSARQLIRTAESGVGSMIADAMRARTNAEIALINAGGIRGERSYRPDSVWRRLTVAEELPFANRVELVTLPGQRIRAAIEHGLAELPAESVRFLQVSGLSFRYDPARPPGRRVVDIRVGGQPLQAARLYRVATIDFLARGGDGFVALMPARPAPPSADAPLLRDVVVAYLQRAGTLRTIEGNRITPIGRR